MHLLNCQGRNLHGLGFFFKLKRKVVVALYIYNSKIKFEKKLLFSLHLPELLENLPASLRHKTNIQLLP